MVGDNEGAHVDYRQAMCRDHDGELKEKKERTKGSHGLGRETTCC